MKGHRAYECFTNPRSRNFRPKMSSRNEAQADKRPHNGNNSRPTVSTPWNVALNRNGGNTNSTQAHRVNARRDIKQTMRSMNRLREEFQNLDVGIVQLAA
ncbi:hypothetical protein BVRB_4g093520 [Beta vulgaris subsp. vulgaris]|uniref:Uncharacterized protein n=1 Tax=Beta vulgaris subsp. vulgaris TaxID=3555 RepID=A0A0J8BE39_BETVV|nr:hypothetical protein BVRB_4g093520 [Beta vulgaris subsp. vulgaris]